MKNFLIIFLLLLGSTVFGQNYVVNSEPYFTPVSQDKTANKKFSYSPTGLACTVDCMAFSTTHKRLLTSMALQSIVYINGPICGSSIRCENVQVKSDSTERNKFYAGSVYFSNYLSPVDKQNELFFQLKNVYTYPGASNKPNISLWNRPLGTNNTAITLEIQYDTVNARQKATPDQRSIRVDTLKENVWKDILVEVNWVSNYTGYVKVYVNKVLKVTYNGPTKDKAYDPLRERIPEALWGIYKFPYKDAPTSANTTKKIMFIDVLKIGNSDTQKEDYFINDNPIPPTVSAGSTQQIELPNNTVPLVGTASDADGTISKVAWTKVSGPSITINSSTQLSTSAVVTTEGTYVLKLTATDNQGLMTSDTMSIVVLPANIPPVVNAGSDITIQLPLDSTMLNGISADVDGTVSTNLWTKVSGPSATIVSPSNINTRVRLTTIGDYIFKLTATDNKGASTSSDIKVTVLQPNTPPFVNAGNDITITLPTNSTILNGTAVDQDGTVNIVSWSQISGPSIATIANASASSTNITNLLEGTYTFRYYVVDNQGASTFDDVTVIVKPQPVVIVNKPPIVDAGVNKVLKYPINSTTLIGVASDADGTIVSYKWAKYSGPSFYGIVSPNSSTTVVKDLAVGKYVFSLTVKDNSGVSRTDYLNVEVQKTRTSKLTTTLYKFIPSQQ